MRILVNVVYTVYRKRGRSRTQIPALLLPVMFIKTKFIPKNQTLAFFYSIVGNWKEAYC